MQFALPIIMLLVGGALGAAFVWLGLRGRDQAIQAVLGERDRQLAEAKAQTADAKAALEREQKRVDESDHKAELAQRELSKSALLAAELSRDLAAEKNLAREKLATLQHAEDRLKETFKAVAADTLKDNSGEFIKRTEERLMPFKESLEKMNQQVQALEKTRAEAYGSLTEQVKALSQSQQKLQSETGNLVKALRQPQQRGQWGELQLDNVLSAAGLRAGLDYEKQQSIATADGARRPDVVVNLPDGGTIVIDAKAVFTAFLNAYEAQTDDARATSLREHSRYVRTQIDMLSSKSYWSQFESSPEFVVMFLPGEAFFMAALEQDRDLLSGSMEKKVLLASPITLIALLRAVAYGWRQRRFEEQVAEIGRQGAELHDRIVSFTEHFERAGDSIGKTAKAYNAALGSLEGMVLPAARRMKDLGAPAKKDLPAALAPVDDSVREIQSKELRRTPKAEN